MSASAHQKTVRSLAPVLRQERGAFSRTVLASVGAHLTMAATAGLGATLVADILAGPPHQLGLLTSLILTATLLHGLTYWWEMVWAHDLAFRVLARLRVAVFDGLERTAPGGLQQRRTGDLVGTAMHDVETLEWFYAHTAPTAVAAVVAPLASLIAVAAIVGDLAIIALIGIVAAAAVPWLFRGVADRQGATVRERHSELTALCLETAQGLRELVGFGRFEGQTRKISEQSAVMYRAQRRYALRSGGETALAEVSVAITALVFLAAGVARLRAGQVSPGELSVATVLALAAFAPVLELGGMVAKLGELGAAAARVRQVIDSRPVVLPVADPDASRLQTAQLRGHPVSVQLHRVGLAYEGGRQQALTDVTLEIPAGSSLAVVGRSGAGKSSLANVLLRLWDPSSGAVYLDGVPLTQVAQGDLPQVVSLVPQEVYLFAMSIKENVRLARPAADEQAVIDACRRAQVMEFADDLPAGLDTMLAERGASLSGGQRQRVAVARALLADPSVLVLDEASSTLDARSEALLGDAINEARRGRTTVVIAHRLSTLRHMDRVVVLEDGRVAQDGNVADLLGIDGPFADLMRPQLQDA
jgi:ATP-binding cassette, subfamily C, bacterial CydC